MNTDRVLHEVVLEDNGADEASEASRRGFLKGITGAGLAGIGAAILGSVSAVATFVSARPAMAAPKGYLALDPEIGRAHV